MGLSNLSCLLQQAEKENDEHKRQEEARRQAEIMMSSQRNKIKTLPSVETAWNYTKDSDEYEDEDDYESTSGSDGFDSSWKPTQGKVVKLPTPQSSQNIWYALRTMLGTLKNCCNIVL